MTSNIADKPVVSVWMIAYNHEEYIAQAIESVLAQKTNFPIEIIIGEDNSTDNTATIITHYAEKYPKIIKASYNHPNLGMMGNMISTLNRCKGKYIALLEGDDYWTYAEKLQKQVNFLDTHPEVSFSFHNANVIYENSSLQSHPFAKLSNRTYSGEEIIANWIVPTASVVLRNNNLCFPDFANNCAHGDILLFLLLLENGTAHSMDSIWSVYRKNDESITNKNRFSEVYIKKVIAQNKWMQSYFKNKYNPELKKQASYWQLALLGNNMCNKKYVNFTINLLHFAFNHPKILMQKLIKKL